MKTTKAKELTISNGLYLLKKDELFLFRGGKNSDGPSNAAPKDEIIG